MNTVVTSREEILTACRQLVATSGLAAVNMRKVAQLCHVALGSLYYYFPSKDELLLATVESVWDDIFNSEKLTHAALPFDRYITNFFEHLKRGILKYPNFFTVHSLSFSTRGQAKGQKTMQKYLTKMKTTMLQVLQKDQAVQPDVFSDVFTEDEFVDFIIMHMMSLMLQKDFNYTVLIEIIRRIIYCK